MGKYLNLQEIQNLKINDKIKIVGDENFEPEDLTCKIIEIDKCWIFCEGENGEKVNVPLNDEGKKNWIKDDGTCQCIYDDATFKLEKI